MVLTWTFIVGSLVGTWLLVAPFLLDPYESYGSCATLQYSAWTKYASFAQAIAFCNVALVKLSGLFPILLTSSKTNPLSIKGMDFSSIVIESGAMVINVFAGIGSLLQFLGWDSLCSTNSR